MTLPVLVEAEDVDATVHAVYFQPSPTTEAAAWEITGGQSSALLFHAPQLPDGGPHRARLLEDDADGVGHILGAQVGRENR